jgi:large subunit ribosomal protein L32
MAVPKKRTSRTRRDKRRATHKASAPRLNECPRCHSPRLPHRVCPVCGTYAGREVIAHEVGEAEPGAPAGEQE